MYRSQRIGNVFGKSDVAFLPEMPPVEALVADGRNLAAISESRRGKKKSTGVSLSKTTLLAWKDWSLHFFLFFFFGVCTANSLFGVSISSELEAKRHCFMTFCCCCFFSYHHRNIQHSRRIFLNTMQHSSSNPVPVLCLSHKHRKCLCSSSVSGLMSLFFSFLIASPTISVPRWPIFFFFSPRKVSLIHTHFSPLHCLTVQIRPFGFTSFMSRFCCCLSLAVGHQ